MPRKKTPVRGSKADAPLESSTLTNSLKRSPFSSHAELFRRSPTPNEFIDDDCSFWPVKGIVGEEVDLRRRSIYQVEWEDWKRPDGTTTTWERTLPGPNTVLRSWKSTQTRKRLQQARDCSDIDLEILGSFMPHNLLSAERACAYEEKLKLCSIPVLDDWIKELKGQDRDLAKKSGPRKRQRENSFLYTPLSPGESVDASTSSSGLFTGQQESHQEHKAALQTIYQVEYSWNASAVDEGAASIRIINEVGNDLPVKPGFVYLESSRNYMDGIPIPDPGFLVGCDCKDGCRNPLLCSCLMESQCIDEDDQPCPAYDKKGRFLFTNRREVVECNLNCTCRNCSNNVAQRPRTVPLEIFKDHKYRWGVRPSAFVSSGTVLGLFTGFVVSREAAAYLDPKEKEYCFDLDTRDDDPEFKHVPKYSMSSYSSGNWSRFINHSCDPTAKVYSVVIDTTLRTNMPYVAFVACRDIPSGQEITIDYNPRGHLIANEGKQKGKGKGRKESDRMLCECESPICRGFI